MWSERKGKGQAQEGGLMNNQSVIYLVAVRKAALTQIIVAHNPRLTIKPDCYSLFLEIGSCVALDWVKVECFSCGVLFRHLVCNPE